ncbi:uncharacterized protein [Spinacia oleracea]|uniref:Putative plant transposon protein domain-containing protein n=1 Tax=Spinacia oleracea TaxID=3562 RepID=A0ABM3RFV1_SPIOL|nr:uncharacterized protein LOC130469339 [Spinacia oleracea]
MVRPKKITVKRKALATKATPPTGSKQAGIRNNKKHSAKSARLEKGRSSDFIPDIRFKNEDYQKLFQVKFGERSVWPGKNIDFESFTKGNAEIVHEWFSFQGWDVLLQYKGTVWEDLVREFYTHIEPFGKKEGFLRTWVRDVTIYLDDEKLGHILGIPHEGIYDDPGLSWSKHTDFKIQDCVKALLDDDDSTRDTKPLIQELPPLNRLLHLLIHGTLNPGPGRKSSLTYLDVFIMFCILLKKKMNLPRMIINNIRSAHKESRTNNLPYGMWLTKVFRHFKIDTSKDVAHTSACHTFSISTLTTYMKCTYDELNSVWVQPDGTQAGIGAVSNQESDPHHGGGELDRQVQGEDPENCIKEVHLTMFTFETALRVGMVESMLRYLHPNIFTKEVMLDIHDKVYTSLKLEFGIREPKEDPLEEDLFQGRNTETDNYEVNDGDEGSNGVEMVMTVAELEKKMTMLLDLEEMMKLQQIMKLQQMMTTLRNLE